VDNRLAVVLRVLLGVHWCRPARDLKSENWVPAKLLPTGW
jgi:hypothetical protein